MPNGKKFHFYNPIKHNKTHIKWLQDYLKQDIPMFSLIVFSERCELKKVTFNDPNVHVFNREYTYWAVRKIWDSSPIVLSEEEIKAIANKLTPLLLTEVSSLWYNMYT